MEILFVSHKYPPATGGMEKQSFELINGLKDRAKIHTLVYEGRGSRIRFFWSLNKNIMRIWKENPGIEIIHFNDGLIAAVSLMHKSYRSLKRTATLHGLDVVFPAYIYQKFILPMFNHFDLLFAVSTATASAAIERGVHRNKIVVVNNGVDPKIRAEAAQLAVMQMLKQKYGLDLEDKQVLLAIGRPVKRKGFSWFIKNVMPQLHPDFVLLLIGPSPDPQSRDTKLLKALPWFLKRKAELFLGYPGDETAIRKLLQGRLQQRVFRLGKLPFTEVTEIMSTATAFIVPNIEIDGDMEGFGLVCLEAAMCGAKVFASASGGITDAIIPGKNGFLLPPGHIASWVDALNNLIGQQKNTGPGAASIAAFTADRFNWEKMSAEYLFHFQNLTSPWPASSTNA